MDWGAIFVGIGAIVTAAGGCMLVIAEFRRRDRREMQRLVDESHHALNALQAECMEVRVHAFKLAARLADFGVIMPPEPGMPE